MKYTILRFKENLELNEKELNEEFVYIRNKFFNTPEEVSFGNWLRDRGAEAITSISEEHAMKYPDDDAYWVLEIHFKSESEYLAFKLKYL